MYSYSLYKKSSKRIQEMLINTRAMMINRIKFGGGYKKYLHEIKNTQWYTKCNFLEYQNRKFESLSNALKNTKQYTELMNTVSKLEIDNITNFPLLNKKTIVANPQNFINQQYRGLRTSGGTSGTTGSPLILHKSYDELRWENAFIQRQLDWTGYTFDKKRAWIRGDMIVDSSRTSPPYWRKNAVDNMLLLSSYHLSIENAPEYLKKLTSFDPYLIQAYPSSIVFLANYLEQKNQYYRADGLKAVLTSSENLPVEDRALIKRRFGCKIFDWYGSYERVAAIGTCEHEQYHLLQDYSFVELLPCGAHTYEIVGSSFNNSLMPLLRYKMNDFVEIHDKNDCPCGRNFPIVSRIIGREDDAIVTPSGRSITRLDHVFKNANAIIEAQIVQEENYQVRVLVVPMEYFSSKDAFTLADKLRSRIGAHVSITVETVSSIERSKNGKFKSIICKVKNPRTVL